MGRKIERNVSSMLERPVCVAQVAIAYAIMSDMPAYPLEVGVLHGLSEGMYQAGELFGHTTKLLNNHTIRQIAVVGGDGRATGGTIPKASWIGSEAITYELERRGISQEEIIVLDEITNSREEAQAIVKMAKEKRLRQVGSISTAYHGGRMFPYMVKAMQESGCWINYHMLAPPRTNWWLPMLSSQGEKTTTSLEATLIDAIKIEDHIKQGLAAPFDQVLYYFKNRSEIVKTQNWDYPGE